MMPIYGRLADIYGRRRILLIAIAVFLAGAIACSLARSMPQLIAARALQGLGAAGLVPIALTVSGDLYSLEERARVQGLFSGVWGAREPRRAAARRVDDDDASAGARSSRSTFRSASSPSRSSRRRWSSRGPRCPDPLDVAGAATLAARRHGAALLRAAPARAKADWASARGPGLFAVAAALARRSSSGFRPGASIRSIPPSLFRRMSTAAPYVAGVLLGTTIFGVDTFVPLFVQGARGGTAGAAGAVVTPARPDVGALGDRRRPAHRPFRLPPDGALGRAS